MPTSNYMPAVTVEVALTTPPDSLTPAWQEFTDRVELQQKVKITRGRADEFSEVQPSKLNLVFDNRDGALTPLKATSPYYPNIKKGRRIRVSARPAGQYGNMLTANQASAETDSASWTNDSGGVYGIATITNSATFAQDGTKSTRLQWPASAAPAWGGFPVTGLVVGRVYTFSAYVRVPTGDPDPRLEVVNQSLGASVGASVRTNAKNVMTRLSVTFTATASTLHLGVQQAGTGVAGDFAYVDALMLNEGDTLPAWTLTSDDTILSRRFDGFVDEWGNSWPEATSGMAHMSVSATSRRGRTARASTLRSLIEYEILADNPVAYWPLSEPEGSTSAGNLAPSQKVGSLQVVTMGSSSGGGALEFGKGTGPDTDGLTAPLFTRVNDSVGRYLEGRVKTPIAPSGTVEVAIEAWVQPNDVAPSPYMGIVSLCTAIGEINMHVGASGTIATYLYAPSVPPVDQVQVGPNIVDDGLTHHVVYRIRKGGNAVVDVDLFRDGVLVDSYTSVPWASGGSPIFTPWTRIHVGGTPRTPFFSPFDGTMAHVALYANTTNALTDARIAAHAEAGADGFAGDTSDERFERIAGYADIDPSLLVIEPGLSTLAWQDTNGKNIVTLWDEVAKTEGGVIFDTRDGLVEFQSRGRRYNAAPALTLDAGTQDIGADYEPKLDDQTLVNDLSATRPGGDGVRAVNDASVAEYGIYAETDDVLVDTDDALADYANWRVTRYAEPLVRVPAMTVDVINSDPADVPAILALDISDVLKVENMPTQDQAATRSGYVEGYSEEIGHESYTIAFNLSPTDVGQVWELDSLTNSLLGTTTLLAY